MPGTSPPVPARSRGELTVAGRPVSWFRDGPLDGRPLLLLAHGSSAPCAHPFLTTVAEGLRDRGLTVVRFHFPYMERRVREGTRFLPDRAPVLIETWRQMVRRAARFRRTGPLFLAGKSLGARMASMLLASGGAGRAAGAVYFGYPLHPAGRKDRLRWEHLPDVPVPQLFVQGSEDPLCDLDLLAPVLRRIGPRARLHVVEGGDHSLAASRGRPFEDAGVWLDVAADFLHSL